MDAIKLAEKELVEVMDRYDIGEADHMDVAISLMNLCGLANPELGKRAMKILMGHLENQSPKRAPGKPKTITPEQIKKIVELKKDGYTQEKIAFEVGVSLSSVRRELKNLQK